MITVVGDEILYYGTVIATICSKKLSPTFLAEVIRHLERSDDGYDKGYEDGHKAGFSDGAME